MEQSRLQHDGKTFSKAVQYWVTLGFNDCACVIDSFIQAIFSLLKIERKNKWAWWNKIVIPNYTGRGSIYLGAVPITKRIFGFTIRDDFQSIMKLGIKAILSVTELFEVQARGPITSPVHPEQWKEAGVQQLQLSTPDFGTIEINLILKGVKYLHWQLQQNNDVYVHCKAGRGRSFLVVLCYLMMYHGMTYDQAYECIKGSRSQVGMAKDKKETALEFERLVRNMNRP